MRYANERKTYAERNELCIYSIIIIVVNRSGGTTVDGSHAHGGLTFKTGVIMSPDTGK